MNFLEDLNEVLFLNVEFFSKWYGSFAHSVDPHLLSENQLHFNFTYAFINNYEAFFLKFIF